MKSTDNLTCSACKKPILEKDLIAWTKKDKVVHLICATAQLSDGVYFIGRAENLTDQPFGNQQHA